MRTRRRPRGEHAHQQPRHLAALLEARAFVIHDCPAGDSLPSIDHVAIGSSGVWVVVSRRVHISRIQLRRSLTSSPKLVAGSTDHSDLLTLANHQRQTICETLADHPDVPIRTAITFAGGQYPLFGTLAAGGHLILSPTALADEVASAGPLSRAESRAIAALLDGRLV